MLCRRQGWQPQRIKGQPHCEAVLLATSIVSGGAAGGLLLFQVGAGGRSLHQGRRHAWGRDHGHQLVQSLRSVNQACRSGQVGRRNTWRMVHGRLAQRALALCVPHVPVHNRHTACSNVSSPRQQQSCRRTPADQH